MMLEKRTLLVVALVLPLAAQTPLPGTAPLTGQGDLAAQMVDGINDYLVRSTSASPGTRAALWKRDYASLERLILFGEGSVRRAAAEFTIHYHRERNHQGLDNKLICPDSEVVREGREVKRRERLGGLLNYYYKAAA
jgi:hypothetical protein